MRHLASLQRIISLSPIPNADAIEVAQVLGWHVVVKKGEFKVGDLCIFCEVDSILPESPLFPEFEFLRKSRFRIKTVKLRGQISQGICFPISLLNQYPNKELLGEGDDVTEILQIKKYDPDILNGGLGAARVRTFPSFIIKTDETRIQSVPSILTEFKGLKCYITEKLDGSSCTIYRTDEKTGICSRNMEIEPKPENAGNIFYELANKYDLYTKVHEWFKGLAIQGEVIGPKIQHNRYGLASSELKLFSSQVYSDGSYQRWSILEQHAKVLGLQTVPYLGEIIIGDHTVDQLVEMSIGQSVLNPAIKREGIVIRSIEPIKNPHREMHHFSFKVINPEFLLKYED